QFAEALHLLAQQLNRQRPKSCQLHFRMGISTGSVLMEPTTTARFPLAGMPIVEAVRLESACQAGEVLMSEDAWAKLPRRVQSLYGPSELIAGKRNERIAARRCRVVPAELP